MGTASGRRWEDVDGNEILKALKDNWLRRRFLIEEIEAGVSEPRKFRLESRKKGSKHFFLVPGRKDTEDDDGNACMKVISDGALQFGYQITCNPDISDDMVAFCRFLVNMMHRRASRGDGMYYTKKCSCLFDRGLLEVYGELARKKCIKIIF